MHADTFVHTHSKMLTHVSVHVRSIPIRNKHQHHIHYMISTESPLVKQEMRSVGANVIEWVSNVLADLVISTLKEKPVDMG